MANFGPKPWTNPFGKISIFGLKFQTSCFYSLESCLFVLEYRKTFSYPVIPQEKKVVKWPILDQNHGLTPLEKSQFFDFSNFVFL